MNRFTLKILGCLLVAVLLSSCSLLQTEEKQEVTGWITYQVRQALPPTALVEVYLIDITSLLPPGEIVSYQYISTQGRQVPFVFSIPYQEAQIQDDHHYVINAQITNGSDLLFSTARAYPVITYENPTQNLEVLVYPTH